MIDDLVRAHRARALTPSARSSAAPRRTRTRSSRRARRSTRSTPRCPDRAGGDGPLRRADRPATTCSTTTATRRRARDRADGLGRRDRARDRGALRRAARKSACCRCGCTGRFRREAFPRRAARACARSRARPDQGAGRAGEPLYPRRLDRARPAPSLAASASDAARDRRPLRPVVEGFHPGDGQGVFDELENRAENSFTVGINDDVSTPASPIDPTSHRAARTCARCSTAWAPTARSAPTRTASRSSPRTPASTRRATSSTTRTSPARRRSRTCASAEADPRALSDRSGELRRLPSVRLLERSTCCGWRRRAPPSCSTAPTAGRGLGPLPRPVQQQIIDKEAAFFVIDASRSPARSGWRAHQHGAADLLLRHLGRAAARRGDRHIKKSIPRPTAKGAEVVRRTSQAVDATLARLHRGRVPARRPAAFERRRSCRRARRSSSAP
jgi:hypothetical protein